MRAMARMARRPHADLGLVASSITAIVVILKLGNDHGLEFLFNLLEPGQECRNSLTEELASL